MSSAMSSSSARMTFDVEPSLGLIICKGCRYAVFSKHLKAHLRSLHPELRPQTARIYEEVMSWLEVVANIDTFVPPSILLTPISALPVYNDGLRCMMNPNECDYVCRKESTMRQHRQNKHRGSHTRQGGGVTREQAIEIKAFKERATKKVACQRLFVEGKNSRYIPLEPQEQAEPLHAEDMDIEMTAAWDDAAILEAFIREGHELVAINRKRQVNLIQSGAPDEVNPWLPRAGWIDYLKDCLRVNLAASVVEPSKELLEDSTLENFRRIDMVIWNGMRNLAKIAQKTTAASSQFVRIEVIQTSVTLDIKTPMQVYFDQDSIEVRARPWQQILMFFLRTQRDHDWTSPRYRFEPIQQKRFKEMVDLASAAIEQEANNSFEDDHDLPPLELAILKFCIELLNHRAKESESDSPLVCASAVLGVGYTEMPWHTPETYPPILSRIMKIARMMIIQWVKECCNTHRQDANRAEKGMIFDHGSDSGYDTDLELPQVSRLASLPQTP